MVDGATSKQTVAIEALGVVVRLPVESTVDRIVAVASGSGSGVVMISVPSLRIVLATRPDDFRRGHDALAATAAGELDLDIYSGLIVIFRSRRGDRLKLLTWDGTGLVMTYKRLEQGRFRLAPDRGRRNAPYEGPVRGPLRGSGLVPGEGPPGSPAAGSGVRQHAGVAADW